MPNLSPAVLYVDDDSDSCELIRALLEMADCKCDIVTAASAGEALNMIADSSYRLYILDYLLPDLSGVTLCRQIRSVDQDTPIIFFTAMPQYTYREAAMRAGADAYLVKPNDLEILPSTVKDLLRLPRSACAA
jgi:DNA-binding response OmpR family regulator